MFENVISFFKRIGKKEALEDKSKNTAKERLQLVLMQDRANVSADFLDMMRQEIIEVIKKYIDVDESQIDVKLTNKTNEDGTVGAPALYANIPIAGIKENIRRQEDSKESTETKNDKQEIEKTEEEKEKIEESTENEEVEEVEEDKEKSKLVEEEGNDNKKNKINKKQKEANKETEENNAKDEEPVEEKSEQKDKKEEPKEE